jgi:hypothetical protein
MIFTLFEEHPISFPPIDPLALVNLGNPLEQKLIVLHKNSKTLQNMNFFYSWVILRFSHLFFGKPLDTNNKSVWKISEFYRQNYQLSCRCSKLYLITQNEAFRRKFIKSFQGALYDIQIYHKYPWQKVLKFRIYSTLWPVC